MSGERMGGYAGERLLETSASFGLESYFNIRKISNGHWAC